MGLFKKILIPVVLLVVAFLITVYAIIKTTQVEWGHHFTFENELNVDIDSLEVIIGNKKTTIESGNSKTLEGNLNVPKSGYPHEVKILIYHDEKTTTLKADSFDCYNCDGSHLYTLKKNRC